MFSHVMLGAHDVAESKAFYDAALGVLGVPAGEGDPKGRVRYMHGGGIFMLTRPIDGNPACHANGGTPCENPPGWRENVFGKLYLAYLRDPAGNKICAVHRPA